MLYNKETQKYVCFCENKSCKNVYPDDSDISPGDWHIVVASWRDKVYLPEPWLEKDGKHFCSEECMKKHDLEGLYDRRKDFIEELHKLDEEIIDRIDIDTIDPRKCTMHESVVLIRDRDGLSPKDIWVDYGGTPCIQGYKNEGYLGNEPIEGDER